MGPVLGAKCGSGGALQLCETMAMAMERSKEAATAQKTLMGLMSSKWTRSHNKQRQKTFLWLRAKKYLLLGYRRRHRQSDGGDRSISQMGNQRTALYVYFWASYCWVFYTHILATLLAMGSKSTHYIRGAQLSSIHPTDRPDHPSPAAVIHAFCNLISDGPLLLFPIPPPPPRDHSIP